MLVMRRRAGESFLIGDGIEIEVLEICGSRVKLGIAAPESVVIQRKEARITREENIHAARSFEPGDISSLLNKVTGQAGAKPVKSLTHATVLTTKVT